MPMCFLQGISPGTLPLYIVFTAIGLSLCKLDANAQEDTVSKTLISILAESIPAEEDLSQFTERLSAYKHKPIDLNHSSPEQLKGLLFLSGLQISNFFSYLQTHGRLKNLLELQSIRGFDTKTIQNLLPFVQLLPEHMAARYKNSKSSGQAGNNEILIRYGRVLNPQKGYKELPGSHYLGSPDKMLFKYSHQLSELFEFTVTAEKDAGEHIWNSHAKSGLDFLSASLTLYPGKRISKIILGDYSLQFGQGLILWTGLSFGKSADLSWLAKNDIGLKPYSGTDEFAFFRGAAATLNPLKNFVLTAFVSIRDLDASIRNSGDGQTEFSTIGKSGLHRTATELTHKGSLGQLISGAALQLKKTNLEIGFLAYHTRFDHAFKPGNQGINSSTIEGKKLINLGLHYNYNLKYFYLFGETGKSVPGGFASMNGAMISLSRSFSAATLIRTFSRNHYTFYNQALSAGGLGANENGVYAGLHFNPNSIWQSALYVDLFHFPGAKYRTDTASSGFDLMGQLNYTPSKTFKLNFRFKAETTEQNNSTGQGSSSLQRIWKDNIRIGADWALNRRLKLQNRIEVNRYKKGPSKLSYGYMLYQDIAYSRQALHTTLRLAFFHTSTYENRIYAFEDDVRYGARTAMYNGTGFRSYINFNYKLSKHLGTWFRYGLYYYPGKEKLGSGLEEIQGNKKSEIRLQLSYKF